MTGRGGRLRVVLVDEHGAFALVLQPLLEARGMAVVGIMTTTEEAVSAIRLGFADLVVICAWVGSILDRWPGGPSDPSLGLVESHHARHQAALPSLDGGANLMGGGSSLRIDGLSQREGQVLKLLLAGASNKTIARRLSLKPNTVRTHLQNIFDKLGVHSRLEAVALMIQRGQAVVANP